MKIIFLLEFTATFRWSYYYVNRFSFSSSKTFTAVSLLLPIAISAFGLVFYYRLLSDDGDEDVSFIDPHNSDIGVTAWSLTDFFNDWICDDEIIEQFLEKSALAKAQTQYGKLVDNQMYCYLPALRLGGRASDLNLDKGDAATHLDFLYQLAVNN